jgi:hypothetical protein
MKFREFEHLGELGEFYSGLAEVVEKHTGSEDSAWLAERLISHGVNNGYQVYSLSKDIKALQMLDRALCEVQMMLKDGAMTDLARMQLFVGIISTVGEKNERQAAIRIKASNEQLVDGFTIGDGIIDSSAFLEFEENAEFMQNSVKRTISEIEKSPLAKVYASKINER